jgi:hypothetical protein
MKIIIFKLIVVLLEMACIGTILITILAMLVSIVIADNVLICLAVFLGSAFMGSTLGAALWTLRDVLLEKLETEEDKK